MIRERFRRELEAHPGFAGRTWVFFKALSVIPITIGVFLFLALAYYQLTLPGMEEIEKASPSLISRLEDRDSTPFKEFYLQWRLYRPLDSIPETQWRAVLAIEDRDFLRHWGVNLSALPGAVLPGFRGERVRGASTLTQQVAKNLFLTPERSLGRKVRELLLSIRLERTYSKREILQFYLNQVYLGAGAYGFEAAARRYFSRPLARLSLAEQALLAGMLQRPEALRPDENPEAANQRKKVVLSAMAELGHIDAEERDAALAESLRVDVSTPKLLERAPYFAETVRLQLEKQFGPDFIHKAGVTVKTTLDTRVQKAVDSCLALGLREIQGRIRYTAMVELSMPSKLRMTPGRILADWDRAYARFDSLFLKADTGASPRIPYSRRYRHAQGAVVVVDNATGGVLALAGGEDFAKSRYNRALQAVRSPGSAMKPIVYATALETGSNPSDLVDDSPLSMPDPEDSSKTWRPHNLEWDYEGPITLRRAFYRSKNIPAIKVGLRCGLDTVIAFARRFGLEQPLRPLPSLSIGAGDATLMEMTAAFSVFPNEGLLRRPFFVREIRDRTGQPVFHHYAEPRPVLSRETAWLMATMLRDVNIRGTAAEVWAGGFTMPSGGKTGTTNDYRDAWYIGFTKRYTAGVWIGADNHQPLGPGHAGTDDALPIWIALMRALHRGERANLFDKDFPRPASIRETAICRYTGRVAAEFCGERLSEYHRPGARLQSCQPEVHDRALALFEERRARAAADSAAAAARADSAALQE